MRDGSVVWIAFGVIVFLVWLNATLYSRRRLPSLGRDQDYSYGGRHGGTVYERSQAPLPPIELVVPNERVNRRLD